MPPVTTARCAMRALVVLLLLAATNAAPAVTARAPDAGPSAEAVPTPRERRETLDRIIDDLRHRTVLVRRDLSSDRPAPRAGRLTELSDGSYYQHADASIVFEELAPARVVEARLRDQGRILLVRLAPPSDLRPRALRGRGHHVAAPLLVELDIGEEGDVREAMRSIVYLPEEGPDEEARARCLARYPDHDERTARLRCGLPRP